MAHDQRSMATQTEAKRQPGISKGIFALTIGLVAAVGFVAGTRSDDLLAAVAPTFGIQVATGEIDLSSVEKTYRELKLNFDGELDKDKLIAGASEGLVKAAGDPYTTYMSAQDAQEFNNELSGQIGGGVGAEIGIRSDQPTIIRVLAGNPAEKAGVKAGDVIVGVNDESAVDWRADEAAEKIRGEVGTTVKLSVLRGNEPKEFTITRAEVNNPSVESKIEEGVGILTLSRFDENTSNLARKAAQKFKQENVRGVVLDMRGNGGGYLDAAQDIAGLWLNDKVVVTERKDGNVIEELKSGNNAVLGGIPTTVLVNGSSASASEIVAGALQDHDAATVIGEQTFGKGTVQRIVDMGGGAQLKVTIARWYTPKGKNITEEGITPNEKVELSAEDSDAGRDPQLQRALKELKK